MKGDLEVVMERTLLMGNLRKLMLLNLLKSIEKVKSIKRKWKWKSFRTLKTWNRHLRENSRLGSHLVS